MNRKIRTTLSLLLAILMIMTTLPTFVLANEDEPVEVSGGISLFSLLPIDEVQAEIDLNGYIPGEIKEISISTDRKSVV